MARRQMRKQHRLKVVLVGNVAAKAADHLKALINAPSTIVPFPINHEDSRLLKELANADVAVGHFFTERMARAARSLKLLQAPNAGVDAFRADLLSPQTTVANAYFHGPGLAEYVIMMVLALRRDLLNLDAQFRKGAWIGSWTKGEIPPEEVFGRSLGLVGYGTIGREVATRARALGMPIKVISAHPPKKKPRDVDFWKGPAALPQLLKESDYIVLACPLNKETRGLIGSREFAQMKRSAFLINVARGAVIQEEALFRALEQQRIAGAAIDVWYRYPKNDKPFRPSRFPFHKLSNLVMTPHVAGWTLGTRQKRFQLVAENIDRLVEGRHLLNVVQGPRRHSRAEWDATS
ncbi:MAG: hydroxyacid dehydrogenase [Acidobacteria bacterium]|nr:MAG: hydroxyacid dehydrogenase [Acidobacteriota bacterium]